MNEYIGHPSQISGVEEHLLVGGRGNGMRIYEINNGKGMFLTVSPDRNGDITRLRYRGHNLSYMSPCGYVAPSYYDSRGTNWLKSFTAGFLTTCGLQAVGNPCTDEGEELPLHGSISNQPSEHSWWEETDEQITVHTTTRDEQIFGRKLVLERSLEISKMENLFEINDTIRNTGDRREPVEVLYHMNIGYPLLSEKSILKIPSETVLPRDEHAEADIENWMHMEEPQKNFRERCYYHKFADERGRASIEQPEIGTGLDISFDASVLDGFVEWKMMGVRDYVLGLECGNCYPDGRDVMRKMGMLKVLDPGRELHYAVCVKLRDL
ncbi:MAG: aldose 1-epimerase family protein [Butyrivibrio sp.]|nr:aldose 1-epimerase family protein [Butyrivibrio sp.]